MFRISYSRALQVFIYVLSYSKRHTPAGLLEGQAGVRERTHSPGLRWSRESEPAEDAVSPSPPARLPGRGSLETERTSHRGEAAPAPRPLPLRPLSPPCSPPTAGRAGSRRAPSRGRTQLQSQLSLPESRFQNSAGITRESHV